MSLQIYTYSSFFPKSLFYPASSISHFDNSTYSVLQAHGGSLLYFSILNATGTPLGSGGITIIDPTAKVKRVAASTLRAVALTTLGQNVFLSWIDEKTNTVNLAVMDSSLERYGDFNLLFSTVNADGYEKTNYGAGIIPVAINEQVGKNIELRQKIMVVWSSSEHTNQLCSIFYDLASYTFTNFQTCPTYTGVTSAIAIEKISDGTEDIMVATGSRDKPDNQFTTAKYSVGQGQTIGGTWNLPTVIHPIDDESVQYAPTLTQYLGDLYMFYVTSPGKAIKYMELVENHKS